MVKLDFDKLSSEDKRKKGKKRYIEDDLDDDFDEFDEFEDEDEDDEFDDDDDFESEDDTTLAKKIMKMVKYIGLSLIFIGLVGGGWYLMKDKIKDKPKEEPKQEQRDKDKKDDKKDESNDNKEDKDKKEEAQLGDNKKIEQKAVKSLERSNELPPEKISKEITTDITEQLKAVVDKKGEFKAGSEKGILTMTGRGNIATLNMLIKTGYTVGDISIYESNNKGIYQFTMVMKAPNNKDNNIVWTGNYLNDNKNVELAKYFGKLPHLTGTGPQVDDEKRTQV